MFIKITNLTKAFGNLIAVDNLNLEINKGQITCLLGPSGCGKTTTLKAIGGFLKPDTGKIIIDGDDITNIPPEMRPTSTVFQSYALFPHMTVIQNVIYGLKFKGLSKKDAIKIGEEYLEIVGLTPFRNKNVQKLSGGQQQRVALARSLVVSPKVLLLDEPLSNLDAKLRVKMRYEIKAIQERIGVTMIFVTHDQEEAFILANTIAVMNEGKLEQVGTPKEIYNKPKSKFVLDFIGSSNIIKDELDNIVFTRPESIEIDKHKGQLVGTVIDKIFLGPYISYKVNIDKSVLNVHKQNNGQSEYEIGNKVFLSLEEKYLYMQEIKQVM